MVRILLSVFLAFQNLDRGAAGTQRGKTSDDIFIFQGVQRSNIYTLQFLIYVNGGSPGFNAFGGDIHTIPCQTEQFPSSAGNKRRRG